MLYYCEAIYKIQVVLRRIYNTIFARYRNK